MDVQHAPDRDRLSGDYLSQKENRYMNNVKTEKKSERKNSLEKMALLQGAHSSGTPPPLAYALNHMGAGGNSLAAAASQAIAATQQVICRP